MLCRWWLWTQCRGFKSIVAQVFSGLKNGAMKPQPNISHGMEGHLFGVEGHTFGDFQFFKSNFSKV